MAKSYRQINDEELETTINILYDEGIVSIYTNKAKLQKELYKVLGNPTKEDKVKRSVVASKWDIPINEKSKISQVLLKANIFDL